MNLDMAVNMRAKYELVSRTVASGGNLVGACGLDDLSVGVGANLVTAELAYREPKPGVVQRVTVQYVSYPNIPIPHGTSTRVGGLSTGAYASLNIGQSTQDAPYYVHENRLRLGMAVGVPPLSILDMVHGVKIVQVSEVPKSLRVGDGCMTDVLGQPLMITTADCVPLIIYDGVHRAVSIVHAGWRGTVARIAQYALQAMERAYGTQPCDVQIAVGPSIGPCCFEVGEDVAEQFGQAFPGQELLHFASKDKYLVNLWRANVLALLEAGVAAEHICVSAMCSACHRELFYSYRRDRRVTGRLATLAMLA